MIRSSLLAGGGLLLSFRMPALAREAGADDPGMAFNPNAFVRIDPQGRIALIVPHTEVGQGIYTSSAMLMAEELDVGLDQVKVEPAPPDLARYMDPILYDQATGGSTSTRADWVRLREAAATARVMLVSAAARRWGVDPRQCDVERGVVRHAPSGRVLGYGDVATDASAQPLPKDVKLKDPADFRLIGTSAKRLDTPAKVDGSATYGIDILLPGLRFGTLALSPVKGGKLLRMDEAAARVVPGVRDVILAGDDVVAVIGDHMWAAKQGLDALGIVWDAGPNGEVTTRSLVASMESASRQPGVIATHVGDAVSAIAGAATKLAAVYQLPFLSHSPMEPLNCTLRVERDRAEVWVGTQVPVRAQKAVADATGLPPDKVTVHNQLMGGAFGRRLEVDSIEVAAAIAKQVDYPLKLVWTREEDMRHDYYRPYYYDHVAAGLDAAGRVVGRTHRVTGPSIYARWAPAAFKGGLDVDAVDCAAETPYDIPAAFVDYVRHEPAGMNTSWWRGVGPTHNVFVVESFIDELADAAQQDPVTFRRNMLGKNPRVLAALNLAVEKAGWGNPLPPRTGRGVAVQFAFGSYVACVIEASVSPKGEILLRRAVVAVDCGMTVNPDTVRAQIEGGLILGLGTAMYNEITLTGGAVDQSNFHDYRTLRMNEAPLIEVHQIPSRESPGWGRGSRHCDRRARPGQRDLRGHRTSVAAIAFRQRPDTGVVTRMRILRVTLAIAAILSSILATSQGVQAQSDLERRGEYLTRAADCMACHTTPGGKPFAGGRAFKLPFGVLYSANITPDPASGIAGYSDDDWVRVLHEGVARSGKHLYPAMPYASYTQLTREDALAIRAYLMSQPAIALAPPRNRIGFPFNQRWAMAIWNFFNNRDRRFEPDPGRTAEYNRGAYLVEALGHCGECHTPRNLMMGLKQSKRLAGAEQVGWMAYNLTSDPVSGLGGWSDGQLQSYLSNGHADGRGPASGPMAEVVEDSLRYLRPEDIHAIVVYLRGVPAQSDGPPVVESGLTVASTDPLGHRLFMQTCAGCHLPNEDGRQSPWAALAGSHSAGDTAGTNLMQVLAHGSEISTDQGVMFMHPFTGANTDAEIAAVGNYTIAEFGARQGKITADQIRAQRDPALKPRDGGQAAF